MTRLSPFGAATQLPSISQLNRFSELRSCISAQASQVPIADPYLHAFHLPSECLLHLTSKRPRNLTSPRRCMSPLLLWLLLHHSHAIDHESRHRGIRFITASSAKAASWLSYQGVPPRIEAVRRRDPPAVARGGKSVGRVGARLIKTCLSPRFFIFGRRGRLAGGPPALSLNGTPWWSQPGS